MLRSRRYASALATLAALVAAGCGSSQAPTESTFRYAAVGLVAVAQPGVLRPARGVQTTPIVPSAPSPAASPARGTLTALGSRGTSEVAWAVRGAVPVYRATGARHPERRFPALNSFGVTQVFLVKRSIPGWLEVYLPVRPNGSTAWVRASSVGLTLDPYRVVVDTRRHELRTLRAGRVVMHAPAGIGKSATPTPLGLFYVLEELRVVPATGPYGPYALGLSAHSNVLQKFGTGDAQVALHGTNEPWTVGQNTSNGCVHLSDRVVSWLAHTLPLGTPVQIV